MPQLETDLQYSVCLSAGYYHISAVVFIQSVPTQISVLHPLDNKPVLVHLLNKLQTNPAIMEIILISHRELVPSLQTVSNIYSISKITAILENDQPVFPFMQGVSACDRWISHYFFFKGRQPLVEENTIRAYIHTGREKSAVACVPDKTSPFLKIPDYPLLIEAENCKRIFDRINLMGKDIIADFFTLAAEGAELLTVQPYEVLEIKTLRDIELAKEFLK